MSVAMRHGCVVPAPLPNASTRATKDGMRVLAHRFVLFLAALAFVAGVPLALAVPPALAAEPCPHEHHAMMTGDDHHQHPMPSKPQHQHDAAACLCCCIGACVGMPDLARATVIGVPITTVAVIYPETERVLDGRSLRPEPAPPRTSALS